MSDRQNGKALVWIASGVLLWLCCVSGTAMAQRGSKPGQTAVPPRAGAPQPTTAQQKLPFSATQLNGLPVRVPPKSTQAKLQEAVAAVEASEQKLKAAAAAMSSYFDKEAACAGKSWTAEEMEKGCVPQDSIQLCKEKLVTACAAGRGPNKGILWTNVQRAAGDLGSKAQAVNGVYGSAGDKPWFQGPTVPVVY